MSIVVQSRFLRDVTRDVTCSEENNFFLQQYRLNLQF